eukprot:360264-Chlamydomonas_euryale.AAC.2
MPYPPPNPPPHSPPHPPPPPQRNTGPCPARVHIDRTWASGRFDRTQSPCWPLHTKCNTASTPTQTGMRPPPSTPAGPAGHVHRADQEPAVQLLEVRLHALLA